MNNFYKLTLILIFSAGAFFAGGQNIMLSDENGPLVHDTAVVAFGAPEDPVIKKIIYITNNSGDNIHVHVKKEEIDVLYNTMNTFCFQGSCYPPFIFQSPNPMMVEPGVTTGDDDFYGEYHPNGVQGISKIRYTVFNANNPDDSVTVNVHFEAGYVGIESLFANHPDIISKPYPNPASSQISFDIDLPLHAGQAELVVRNLLGALVISYPVNESNGKLILSVHDLSEGFYFYTFYLRNNQALKTGRFVVKR